DGTPYSHPSFESILPDTTNNERPRTAAYISKSRLDILCSYRSDLLPHLDGDILPLQVLAGKEKFTLWNIYNERKKLTPDSRPLYTMDRKTPLPLQPQRKKKPHQIFRRAPTSLVNNQISTLHPLTLKTFHQ